MNYCRQTLRKTAWLFVMAGCALLLPGCGGKTPPPYGESPQPEATVAPTNGSPPTPAIADNALLGDSWDAIYLGGVKVGHAHFAGEEKNGQLQRRSTSVMKIQRFGQKVTLNLTYASVLSPQGRLLSFSSEMTTGPQTMEAVGEVVGERLSVQTATQGKSTSSQLEWQPEWGGFFATEASLCKQPMQPGETRSIRALLPVFTQVAEVTLRAIDREATPLLQGERELLRIESAVAIAGNTIDTTLWTDAGGEVLKSYSAGLEQYSYRVSKSEALEASRNVDFDLGQFSIVPVEKQLADPHAARRIVYRMTLPNKDPATCFVSGASQQVTSLGNHQAEVVVAPLTLESGRFPSEKADSPSPDDTAPNNLIQSDDPLILKMASDVAPNETEAWAVALALERYTHETITAKNFSQAFATAAEVAQSHEGDCTEHAVLLAALCRARKIPARTAIGLVYYPRAHGFAYHMWTEVWSTDRWLALDATLGQGGISATHIKIAQSNLKGANAYNAFLPVIQILGQLKMEILSVE